MIKFACKKCGSKEYKVVLWELKNEGSHKGIYCNKCGKWFKFLRDNEVVDGLFCKIEKKQQRPRRKGRAKNAL